MSNETFHVHVDLSRYSGEQDIHVLKVVASSAEEARETAYELLNNSATEVFAIVKVEHSARARILAQTAAYLSGEQVGNSFEATVQPPKGW